MSEDLELGRRAVACKGWRWLPGMLGREPLPFLSRDNSEIWLLAGECYRVADVPSGMAIRFDECADFITDPRNLIPVLTDPATLGCLLALVMEAAAAPPSCIGDTEAEALVAALEAAP